LPRGDAPQILATELSDEPINSAADDVPELADGDDLLGNPFPELSESQADGKPAADKPATVVKSEKAEESNPFSGLKLDAEEAEATVQQTAADAILLPKLPDLPAPAELAAPDDAAPAGQLPEITPAEKPVVKSSAPSGAHSDKLQQIAERSELTGLKGFCPVALRDHRELKDARPSFQAEFNGDYYNFSSAEALAKFKADPETYAPAAGGQDVVLASNEGTSREGSLDRAVWYRNKLYLFSSKDSHEAFVASPKKFAVDLADDE
jgi:YHS domain-containing protein